MGIVAEINRSLDAKNKSIGDEIVEWAEKYHPIKSRWESYIEKENEESYPYSYFRELLIEQINKCCLKRLGL